MLDEIADRLIAGEVDPVTAGRQLKAAAEGATAFEWRMIEIDQAARAVLLNSIGLSSAAHALENALPRRRCPVDPVDGEEVRDGR